MFARGVKARDGSARSWIREGCSRWSRAAGCSGSMGQGPATAVRLRDQGCVADRDIAAVRRRVRPVLHRSIRSSGAGESVLQHLIARHRRASRRWMRANARVPQLASADPETSDPRADFLAASTSMGRRSRRRMRWSCDPSVADCRRSTRSPPVRSSNDRLSVVKELDRERARRRCDAHPCRDRARRWWSPKNSTVVRQRRRLDPAGGSAAWPSSSHATSQAVQAFVTLEFVGFARLPWRGAGIDRRRCPGQHPEPAARCWRGLAGALRRRRRE